MNEIVEIKRIIKDNNDPDIDFLIEFINDLSTNFVSFIDIATKPIIDATPDNAKDEQRNMIAGLRRDILLSQSFEE